MLTLFTSLISFLAGGLPKVLDYFQSKQDHAHEIEMARLQKEQALALAAQGYEAQAHIEAMHTEQVALTTTAATNAALLQHDAELGKGASQWVLNLRALVRPIITYGLFFLFVGIECAGFWYAVTTHVDFKVALDQLWNADTQTIWSSIVAFWFGTQAFGATKKR